MSKLLRSLRALILEDSEKRSAELVSQLITGGFDVQHVRVNTLEGLVSALKENTWEVVISGYPLSAWNEMEALEPLRNQEVPLPVVLVADPHTSEIAAAALRAGARDCLARQNGAHLVAAVERELRDAEERGQRQRLQSQVYLLQRFESVGRLAGGIAHDFNNVLAAILGSVDLELQEFRGKPSSKVRMRRIREQAERGARLTAQLLAYARRQVLQPQNLDLNKLVTETVSFLEKMIGAQIHIHRRLGARLPPAWGDRSQIEQVVMNLCLNARDAMQDGGTLRIETKRVQVTAEDEAVRTYFRRGEYVGLFVADTGMGMDRATVERIFEPFFTTKEAGKGSGLGLATVYGIVKQHNGIIEVESELNKGSTFQVYLPVGSGAPEASVKGKSEPIRRGSEKLLVVDDNEGVRDALQEMLEAWGYAVLVANDVEKGSQLFENMGNRSHLQSLMPVCSECEERLLSRE